MKIEITIPVLNEEETLEKNIEIILEFIECHCKFPQIKIIIADNGSTDGTQNISENIVRIFPNVTYIRLEDRGVGRALKCSWLQSNADIVGYMDLDIATDLAHLNQVFRLFQGDVKLVYGTRLHKDSRVIGRPLKREIISRVFNIILRRFLKVQFSDGMCGFKFLRRDIFKQLLNNGAKSDGWFFSTELLVVSEWLSFSTKELPVNWTDDPVSKVKIVKLTKEYIKAMVDLRKYRRQAAEVL